MNFRRCAAGTFGVARSRIIGPLVIDIEAVPRVFALLADQDVPFACAYTCFDRHVIPLRPVSSNLGYCGAYAHTQFS